MEHDDDEIAEQMARNTDRCIELHKQIERAEAAGQTELADKLRIEQRLVIAAQETLMSELGFPDIAPQPLKH